MADKEEETRPLVGIGPGTPWDYKQGRRARVAKAAAAAESARHWQQARIKEETRPLVGIEPLKPADKRARKEAARQQARIKEAERVLPRGGSRTEASEALPVAMKTHCSPVGGGALSEEELLHLLEYEPAPVPPVPADAAPRRACNWLRLLFSPRPLSAEELDAQDAALHDQEVRRCSVSRSELRAINHKIVLQCLEWYNSTHPGKEYEPAPGVVTRCSKYNKSLLWTHGNFLARRKRSGCSFLPAPRTLFFFELLDRYDVDEVITCTPLDETVTEAYNFLGFPLGWGTRRDGGCDCVCKTCYRQFHVPHIDLKRTCICRDSKVEAVCRMCYLHSDVLHPSGGGFAYGHNKQNFAY